MRGKYINVCAYGQARKKAEEKARRDAEATQAQQRKEAELADAQKRKSASAKPAPKPAQAAQKATPTPIKSAPEPKPAPVQAKDNAGIAQAAKAAAKSSAPGSLGAAADDVAVRVSECAHPEQATRLGDG